MVDNPYLYVFALINETITTLLPARTQSRGNWETSVQMRVVVDIVRVEGMKW